MKAKLIFVILILLMIIICYYISNKIQNSIKNKETFNDTSDKTYVDPIELPIYSLSLNNTPYLTYLSTDKADNKNDSYTLNSHIRFVEDGTYVPIKITPICQFDTEQDQLLFYFLLDRIDDDDYDSYDPKVLENDKEFNAKKKNLPIMTNDYENIYNYKIFCDNTNVENQYLKLKTNNDFMLPYLIDPYEFTNDINTYKLNDLSLGYKKVNNETIDDPESLKNNKLVIPKLISGDEIRSLNSLGISLFNFSIDSDAIDIIYKPSINYTESYDISFGLYSYHKINCIQMIIPIKNNKFLNLENPNEKLKFKFILQSISPDYPLNDKRNLLYDFDKYPNTHTIFNNETSFNINKESYNMIFYITETEYHLIKDGELQLVACLYSSIKLDEYNIPRRLYFEHVLNFNLPDDIPIIKRENDLDKRINSNDQDAEFFKIKEKYTVLPIFALNTTIDVSPNELIKKEGFKNNDDQELKKKKLSIKKNLILGRYSNIINYLLNYSLSKVYHKDSEITKNKFKKYIDECKIIKNYNTNENLLDGFIPMKFNTIEKFQEQAENLVRDSDLYTSEHKLNLKILSNDSNKTFNTSLEDYMYPNTGNINNKQHNSVRVTQQNYKNVENQMFSSSIQKNPLEYFNGEDTHTLSADNEEVNLKYLVSKELITELDGDLSDLKSILKINKNNTINYQFNDEAQDYLYSNNLLFRAQSKEQPDKDGVYNRLIEPGKDIILKQTINEPIPSGFKINVYNHTLHYQRGRRKSHHYCNWHSFGKWILIGAILLITIVATWYYAPGIVAGAKAGVVSNMAAGINAGLTAKAIMHPILVATILTVTLKAAVVGLTAGLITTGIITDKLDTILNDALIESTKDYIKKISDNIQKENKIIVDNYLKILKSVDINFKKRSVTTEDIVYIKSLTNISDDEKLIEHPFVTEKKKGNKSLNQPSSMHIGNCDVRHDLLTVRKFRDRYEGKINVKPMSANNNLMGSIEYHKSDFQNNNSDYQHASPARKYIEFFTYMDPKGDNKDGYNSYIDLSDADISINDFGGINYYETYRNYLKNGDNYINGVINLYDGPGRPIDYNTRSHGKGNLPPVNFTDDYNHISASHKYIEEIPLLFDSFLEPYKIKYPTKSYNRILQILHYCGCNQLLLTNKNPLSTDISNDTNFVSESIVYNIDKFLRDITPDDTFKNINKNNQNKNKINQNNNVNQLQKQMSHKTINRFQDTEFIPEYQLGVLDENNLFTVNIEDKNKILKSGYKVDGRDYSQNNETENDNLETEIIKNSKKGNEIVENVSTEDQEISTVELDFDYKFITDNYDLMNKFKNNSVIFENNYYYIKLPVVYEGQDFYIKDHNFYMTLELYEYPNEKYTYPINEAQHFNDPTFNTILNRIENSRIGTSVYNIGKYKKNNGFLKKGDVFNFIVRIDKNIIKSQKESKDTKQCRNKNEVGRKACRIILSEHNFAIVYLKNYDYKLNIDDKYLGKIESFVYREYPFKLHPNEENFLKKIVLHNNNSVKKRFIGRKIINGITFNEESFYGLRSAKVPSLVDDVRTHSINGKQLDSDMYFCGNFNELKLLKVGYDDSGITGIEGICTNSAKTDIMGKVNEDGSNMVPVSINNKKIVVGVRDLNINYEKGYNDLFTKNDKNDIGKPYYNKTGEDKKILKNYIHEIAPFEVKDNSVVINDNKRVGSDKELFYVNDRKILQCENSFSQRIVGFTALKGENDKLKDFGILCENIPTVPYTTTTTTKPVSNDLKPKLKPYRIRDENNMYIGVDRKVDDIDGISYNIIFAKEPPLDDHRFKFYITYFRNSDSLYYITSSKYLVENHENIILTTTNLKKKSNDNTQIFTQLRYGEADQNHAYQIKLIEEEDEDDEEEQEKKFNIIATFVLNLDDTYCNLTQRFSTAKFSCTKNEKDATKFILEPLKEDLKRTTPTRKVTQLEHEMVRAPRDLESKYGFNVNVLNERINDRNIKLNAIQKISDSFFFK